MNNGVVVPSFLWKMLVDVCQRRAPAEPAVCVCKLWYEGGLEAAKAGYFLAFQKKPTGFSEIDVYHSLPMFNDFLDKHGLSPLPWEKK